MKRVLYPLAVAMLFVATIFAANLALEKLGVITVLGIAAPAGVFFAGLGFLLRDALHEVGGRAWVLGAIGVGAFLSWYVGDGVTIPGGLVPIAAASGCAFLLSELADFSVYAPLRKKTLAGALGVSQVAGAAVDSAVFLYLALGSLAFFAGQFALKTALVLPVLAALVVYRMRRRGRVVVTRPLRDEEALALVKSGALRPHEAPLAVLRDLQHRQSQS